jgi:hypothetical protein
VIGYGRGSLSGLKYATSCDKPLSHYVNIAAPFLNSAVISEENKLALEKQVSTRIRSFTLKRNQH